MSAPPPILAEPPPVPEKVLRRLFLTLFLRGRGARGLNRQTVPKSVGSKLATTLIFYALFGCTFLYVLHQPVFALAVYTHAMTFVFLGMFIAASSGEILFNREEADILLHRPVTSKAMLWAKIRVLVEVSIWIAAALNLVGFIIGIYAPDGGLRFPVIHALSTCMEALFCTSCVVLMYQLCLRWFGREKLEGIMTTAQVLVTIAAVLSAQILPRLIFRYGQYIRVEENTWWIYFLPPAWFAGLDDALAGSSGLPAWILCGLAVVSTGTVLWLAFSKLSESYETGLQLLGETQRSPGKGGGSQRWLSRMTELPPLCWWLRNPVSRASFLLTIAYLVRDRDVKLRVYPGVAPVLIIPFVFLFQNQGGHHRPGDDITFMLPFSGIYLGMVPLMALQFLQFSQQWQASDIFRCAPLAGPGAICHGARRAIMLVLVLPMMVLFTGIVWLMIDTPSHLLLLLPGIIALPVYAQLANVGGRAVIFSQPTDAAKSSGRGLMMFVTMIPAFGLAFGATMAWNSGYFLPFLLTELAAAAIIYWLLRWRLSQSRWSTKD
jgi:ABC-2 type transport system permease protein